jgi:transposase
VDNENARLCVGAIAGWKPLPVVLVAGQAHELAPSLQLPRAPARALADMACDAAEFRSAAEAMGATPVVPSRKNAKLKKPCPSFTYRHRNLIERCWSRLKEWRAIATRYDKAAASYGIQMRTGPTRARLDFVRSVPIRSRGLAQLSQQTNKLQSTIWGHAATWKSGSAAQSTPSAAARNGPHHDHARR